MPVDPHDHEGSASDRSWGRTEKIVAALLAVAAVTVAMIFVLGESLIQRDKAVDERRSPTPPAPTVDSPPSPAGPVALAALERFFEASDVPAMAAMVVESERVMPMMEDYHIRRGHPFPTMGRVSPGQEVHRNGATMVFFEVEPYQGARYPVAMVWNGSRFLVDWESLTAFGTMDWMEFIESQPSLPQTLRVYVRVPGKHRPSLQPVSGETTFKLEHRDYPDPVEATAVGQTAETLNALASGRRTPVTLEIRWKNEGGEAKAEITRVLFPGWSR